GRDDERLLEVGPELGLVKVGPAIGELPSIRAVTDDTGRVRKQLRDGGARDRRVQAIDIVPGRVVEFELALLTQLQNSGGREALGMRGDAKAMARGQRLAGAEIGGAERAFEHDPVAMRDRD